MSKIKNIINRTLAPLDLSMQRNSTVERMRDWVRPEAWEQDMGIALDFGPQMGAELVDLMKASKSQSRQDIFVLHELGTKHGGYFVDFGATDGVSLSNSYLLEKNFGYTGILAEPNPSQRRRIAETRSAAVEERCVWNKSGQTLKFLDAKDLSTIAEFSDSDHHKLTRAHGRYFEVQTISLTDMLIAHEAPATIDYLSIDTEGSEYDILLAHDFSRFTFRTITVEHNYTSRRRDICDLLHSYGYVRKFEHLSMQDDWYALD